MSGIVALLAALGLPLAIGALGSVVTIDAVREWYPTQRRPSFAPPNWVFAPVWTALYLTMGTASWLVWRTGPSRPEVRTALILYAIQLGLNLAWSWLFFGLRKPSLALVEILALLAAIAATTWRFAEFSRGAALLMAPYLAWVGFATVLNAGFWWLNRPR